jgi:hypothetical protein
VKEGHHGPFVGTASALRLVRRFSVPGGGNRSFTKVQSLEPPNDLRLGNEATRGQRRPHPRSLLKGNLHDDHRHPFGLACTPCLLYFMFMVAHQHAFRNQNNNVQEIWTGKEGEI